MMPCDQTSNYTSLTDATSGDFVASQAAKANGHLAESVRPSVTYVAIGSSQKGEETTHYPDEDFGPVWA